jgi:Holliday junction resolvase RusA-like endonuclease
MEFVFKKTPVAQQRPRFGQGRVFNPQKKIKTNLKGCAALQMRSQRAETVLKSPVSFNMSVYVSLPQSWSQKRKNELLGKPVTTKPDLDNYLKFYLDVLNGIAYQDDKQVSEVFCQKLYAKEACVKVHITEKPDSLVEEIKMLGEAAVQMHEGLDCLYHWSISLASSFPDKKVIKKVADFVKERCLESGLFEIYPEEKK